MTKDQQELECCINDLIQACHSMESLLVTEQTAFRSAKIDGWEKTHQEKIEILAKIQQLSTQLSTKFASSPDLQPGMIEVIDRLKEQALQCYRKIQVNNTVVSQNLQQLKSLWDQFKQVQQGNQTYTRTGQID